MDEFDPFTIPAEVEDDFARLVGHLIFAHGRTEQSIDHSTWLLRVRRGIAADRELPQPKRKAEDGVPVAVLRWKAELAENSLTERDEGVLNPLVAALSILFRIRNTIAHGTSLISQPSDMLREYHLHARSDKRDLAIPLLPGDEGHCVVWGSSLLVSRRYLQSQIARLVEAESRVRRFHGDVMVRTGLEMRRSKVGPRQGGG